MTLVVEILESMLKGLYQNLPVSLVLTVLAMFVFLYVRKHGWRETLRIWVTAFRTSKEFRRFFLLILCVAMILSRTLLCRSIWSNPLSNVLGTWGFYDQNGELYTENIQNLFLFAPLALLLLWAVQGIKPFASRGKAILFGTASGAIFSGTIELCQLLFKLGTFQICDLVFNTLGAFLGAVVYALWHFRNRKPDQAGNKEQKIGKKP